MKEKLEGEGKEKAERRGFQTVDEPGTLKDTRNDSDEATWEQGGEWRIAENNRCGLQQLLSRRQFLLS